MARGRRGARRRGPTDIEAVLAGRDAAPLGELFRLVHLVNPTGKGLTASERERRYADKSRLQSLLVEQFDEELIYEAVADEPGVVSIRHRSGTRDACHAVLEALSPDARSRVLLALDTEAGATSWPDTSSGSSFGGDARQSDRGGSLREGRAALEAYDYETAEAAFLTAHQAAPSLATVEALLELWVELLADDRRALALGDEQSARLEAQPRLRAMLGLAAARAGELELAAHWLEGAEGPVASRAWTRFVDGALAEGAADRVRRGVEGLREVDPAAPGLPAFEERLAALRAAPRVEAEQALLAVWERRDEAGAEAEAQALLERWANSTVARRVLREVAAERVRRERAAALEAAAAAERRGDQEARRRHLRRALDRGAEAAVWGPVLEALEARAAEHRAEEAAARVQDALGGGLAAGLAVFADLAAEVRGAVQSRVGLTALDWLEATDPSGRGRWPRGAVDAVCALEAATTRRRAGDPDGARRALLGHRRALRGVPAFQELLETLREGEREAAQARAATSLEAARRALGAHELDGAERAVATAAAAAPDRQLRAQVEAIRHQIEALRASEGGHARVDAAIARGDLPLAWHLARSLPSTGHDAETWAAREREIYGTLCAQVGWEAEVRPRLSRALVGGARMRDPEAPACVHPATREVAFAVRRGAWLFVVFSDLDGGGFTRCASLRLPVPPGPSPSVEVCWIGDTVWIASSDALAGLNVDASEAPGCLALAELLCVDDLGLRPPPEEAVMAPDGRHLWLLADRMGEHEESGHQPHRLFVVDLPTRRLRRSMPPPMSMSPVWGEARPLLAATYFEDPPVLFDANGKRRTELRVDVGAFQWTTVVRHPTHGRVAVGADFLDPTWSADSPAEEGCLALFPVDPAGRLGSSFVIADSNHELVHSVATSLAAGVVYVLMAAAAPGRSRVVGLSWPDASAAPEVLFDALVGADSRMITDELSQYVYLEHLGARGWDRVRLGRDAEALPAPDAFAAPLRSSTGVDAIFCGLPGTKDADRSAILALVEEEDNDARREWAAEQARTRSDDLPRLIGLARAARRLDPSGATTAPFDDAVAAHLPAPEARLHLADAARVEGRYEDAAELLAAPLPPALARHGAHVSALVALRQGDLAASRRHLEAGEAHEGGCELGRLRGYLEVLTPERWRALLDARDAVDAGRPRDAIAMLEAPELLPLEHPPTVCLAAEAWLAVEATTAADRLCKRLTLSSLGDVLAKPEEWRVRLPIALPPSSDERVSELASRAQEWLAAAAPGGGPPRGSDARASSV